MEIVTIASGSKNIKSVLTTVGPVGSDEEIVSEQAIREELSIRPARLSGTSEGTGSDQVITHGFGTTWTDTHFRIRLVSMEAGCVFSNYTLDSVSGRDHFHVTATSGKNWGWIAESW